MTDGLYFFFRWKTPCALHKDLRTCVKTRWIFVELKERQDFRGNRNTHLICRVRYIYKTYGRARESKEIVNDIRTIPSFCEKWCHYYFDSSNSSFGVKISHLNFFFGGGGGFSCKIDVVWVVPFLQNRAIMWRHIGAICVSGNEGKKYSRTVWSAVRGTKVWNYAMVELWLFERGYILRMYGSRL